MLTTWHFSADLDQQLKVIGKDEPVADEFIKM